MDSLSSSWGGEKKDSTNLRSKFAVTALPKLEKLEEVDLVDPLARMKDPPKRKDTPAVPRKFIDANRVGGPEEYSHSFGSHLVAYRYAPRSTTYSTMSDIGPWTPDEPCSSAQAEARIHSNQYSRDSGYSSPSPAATFLHSKFCVTTCGTSVKRGQASEKPKLFEVTEADMMISGPKMAEKKKEGIEESEVVSEKNNETKKNEKAIDMQIKMETVALKGSVSEVSAQKVGKMAENLKKEDIPNGVADVRGEQEKFVSKTVEEFKPVKKAKPEMPKELRSENMPAVVPNFFEGKLWGYLVAEMAAGGTEATVAEFERNPDKFFKRFDPLPLHKKVMPLLFGKSHKTPADVVKNLREVLIILDKLPPPKIDKDGHVIQDKKYDKALEEVSKNVSMIKAFIYGNDATDPGGDHVVQVAQLAQEVYNANVLPMLVKMLPKFEFECKKDVGQIFNNLLRRQIGTRSPTVEYLGARPEILIQLVQGYSVPDIALTCGLMLRECIRHDHLAKIIITSDVFYTFFLYVQSEVFDIASDAFSTFKELTTRHKTISAEFLDAHYDTFFAQYQNLLNSSNYVTRRQSLKLLGELLLDRHNFNIMNRYISNPENLKLMMELLRDKSRNIQYEAFHVFKVFVANPNKPRAISDILNRNREKLVEFLGEFHNDRTDDEQFNDEKAYLIKQIQEMKGSPKDGKKHKTKEEEQPGTSEGPAPSAQPGPSEPSKQQ